MRLDAKPPIKGLAGLKGPRGPVAQSLLRPRQGADKHQVSSPPGPPLADQDPTAAGLEQASQSMNRIESNSAADSEGAAPSSSGQAPVDWLESQSSPSKKTATSASGRASLDWLTSQAAEGGIGRGGGTRPPLDKTAAPARPPTDWLAPKSRGSGSSSGSATARPGMPLHVPPYVQLHKSRVH